MHIPQNSRASPAKCSGCRKTKPACDYFYTLLFWDGQQTLSQLICTNSTQLMEQATWLALCLPRPGCNLASAQWKDCFPTSQHCMGGCTGTQFPISLYRALPVPLDTVWDITNLLGVKSSRVSPLPALHFPSNSFTTTSPHADHSSEVVTVGGVLGGVCVFVLSVWLCAWLCGWGSVCGYACFPEKAREDGEEAGKMLLQVLPEKRFVYSKKSQRLSVLLVLLIQYHTLLSGAEEQQRPKGEKLLHWSFTVRFQQSTWAPCKHWTTLTRIITSRFDPLVQDKVHIW